jgi:hypothetical protein
MKRIARAILAATAPALVILSGCAGGSPSAAGAIPYSREFEGNGAAPFHRTPAPDAAKSGIYVSALNDVLVFGFKSNYRRGRGPMCTIYTGRIYPRGIAADAHGNLIVTRTFDDSVAVYRGPGVCGRKLGEFRDPYGPPMTVASLNAATGTIVLGNAHFRGHLGRDVGGVVICTLQRGCTEKLKSPNITGYAWGVALAKNGDCWLTSENSGSTGAAMTYWKGCTGVGQPVTGFQNAWYGSLSIDKQGNLVSIDFLGGASGQLWVYSGCNPACTLVGGPFALEGNPLVGALNATGDTFGVIETSAVTLGGYVDIYKYTPTKLTYEYSFDSSFAPVADPIGFAYSPALEL